jgi:hypothetical protein
MKFYLMQYLVSKEILLILQQWIRGKLSWSLRYLSGRRKASTGLKTIAPYAREPMGLPLELRPPYSATDETTAAHKSRCDLVCSQILYTFKMEKSSVAFVRGGWWGAVKLRFMGFK